jgi:hypothetical protein
MSEIKNWGKFREYVKSKSKDYGSEASFILAFGLASKITEVYEVSQREVIKQESYDTLRMTAIKKVLWYIASLENLYGLPDSAASAYFNEAKGGSRGFEDLNLLEIMADSLSHSAEVSIAVADGVVYDLQYHINGILVDMADLCAAFAIDTVACISSGKAEVVKPKKTDVRDIFKVARKASSQRIKERKEEEVLFDIKMDRRKQDPYKGITIKKGTEKKTFYAGDMITDFFDASNYCAKTFTEKKYTHNYGVEFRTVLNQRSDEVCMGFIYEGGVMTAIEARDYVKESHADGKTVTLGENGRPILLTPAIKTLDDLLLHVGAVKAIER